MGRGQKNGKIFRLKSNYSMFGTFPCFGSGIPEKKRVATGASGLAEMYMAIATFNF